ncbi:MAG: hypothetical protein ABSB40_14030 [Nitrososphaeria archaeon]|jgi:hypothetical protein
MEKCKHGRLIPSGKTNLDMCSLCRDETQDYWPEAQKGILKEIKSDKPTGISVSKLAELPTTLEGYDDGFEHVNLPLSVRELSYLKQYGLLDLVEFVGVESIQDAIELTTDDTEVSDED